MIVFSPVRPPLRWLLPNERKFSSLSLSPILLFLFICSSSFQKVPSKWPVSYQAEVLCHVLNANDHWKWHPATDSTKADITFELPRDAYYFEEEPDSIQERDANNLFKLIYSYIIKEYPDEWESVNLKLVDPKDTTRYQSYSWGPGYWKSLNTIDLTIEDRFTILSTVLPSAHRDIRRYQGRLKHRFLGIILPVRPQWDDHDWDQIEVTNYSTALGSLIYDYVLQRQDDQIATVFIQYSKNYKALDSPVFVSYYPMNCMLFSRIKKQNDLVILERPSRPKARPYSIGVEDRLAAVSYLLQADIRCSYTAPHGIQKGICVIDYFSKEREVVFPDNDPLLTAKKWASLVVAYCLGDSLQYYDSIKIHFYDKQSRPLYGWSFPVPNHILPLTIDTRMQALINSLPFTAKADFHDSVSTVNFTIADIPHFSPREHLVQYFKILTFVADDFVFGRERRSSEILYTDPKREGWVLACPGSENSIAIQFLRKPEEERHRLEKSELPINYKGEVK